MQLSIVKEDLKISFVGMSGTGKSLSRRVIQKSLGIAGLSSGDFMRDLVQEKYKVDLDKFTGNIVKEDDRNVDERAIRWLKEPGAKAIDSRTTSAFLYVMEQDGTLPINSTLRIFVDCDPDVRAERALSKFRKKPGLENITPPEVMKLLAERDESDEERIIDVWKDVWNIRTKESLYGVPEPNIMSIDTVAMKPEKVLFTILAKLTSMSHLSVSSLPLVYKRGLHAIAEEMGKKI
jgi:cytidylate kinase